MLLVERVIVGWLWCLGVWSFVMISICFDFLGGVCLLCGLYEPDAFEVACLHDCLELRLCFVEG